MKIENKIDISTIASNLRISEKGVMELCKKNHFVLEGRSLTASETKDFCALIDENNDLVEKRAQENLESVVRRFIVVVDTCTLLNDNFPAFYKRMEPLLIREGKKIIIPTSVVSELKKLLFKPDVREKAANTIELLWNCEQMGTIEVLGEDSENFGDQQILALASKLFMQKDVLLITADKALSLDALHLNHLESIKGHEMAVSMVNRYGYLSRFLPEYARSAEKND